MDERDWLAEQFEARRAHLRAVAYRMLGSGSDADDAIQETWLRVSRAGTDDVENLTGWLTTIVARVCLTMLQSRTRRREAPLEDQAESLTGDDVDPEQEAVRADSVGLALLVVLDTLTPAERLAFVLHDLFGVPFDEIAEIIERSPAAARQLASRARRRVRGASPASDADQARRREIVDAFLAASRGGDFEALLSVLDPDVVLRADETAVRLAAAGVGHGAPPLAREIRGAAAVADTFSGRAAAVQPALVGGTVEASWAPDGKPRSVVRFTIIAGEIVGIEVIADPEHVRELDVRLL
jgi:RNA polymerase sigma factor (sigma-70 family)